MTATQAAFVGCRLLALLTTLGTIGNAAQVWSQLAMRANAPKDTRDIFFQSLPAQIWHLGMAVFFLALLWACPSWLIRWVAGRAEESPARTGNTDWAPALLAAVGLYYVLTNMSSVVNAYSRAFGVEFAPQGTKSTFWAEVLSMGVAVLFVIGSKRLLRGVRAFWNVSEE